jgi:hypothetical protein
VTQALLILNSDGPFTSLRGVSLDSASVRPVLDGAVARGVLWQAAPGRFLLEVPDVARYLVEDGRRIVIEPLPQADEVQVARFLYMTPLAALYFQRGVPAFHAAAVVGPDGAVLLAGDSGAGKSTLLAALLQRGWRLLADELSAVDVDARGKPTVLPTSAELVLWPDAKERLKMDAEPEFARARFVDTPQPLHAIWWLSVHNKDEVEAQDLEGTERFRALATLTYNTHIAEALLDRASLLRCAAALADVPMRRLRRPRGQWSVDELAERVMNKSQDCTPAAGL